MNKNTTQLGFTLIEMIAVLLVLGVLAVTAATKFISFKSNANIAVLETMGEAIRSSNQLVYSKSVLQGTNEQAVGNVDLDGDGVADIETRYGYPSGSRHNGVAKAMDSRFDQDWIWSTNYNQTIFYLTLASFTHTSGAYVNQVPIVASNCYLIYNRAATLGSQPTLQYFTSGC